MNHYLSLLVTRVRAVAPPFIAFFSAFLLLNTLKTGLLVSSPLPHHAHKIFFADIFGVLRQPRRLDAVGTAALQRDGAEKRNGRYFEDVIFSHAPVSYKKLIVGYEWGLSPLTLRPSNLTIGIVSN